MSYNIDCKLLLDAMNYYQELGYKPLTAPMLVDKDVVEITLPAEVKAKEHLGLYYVGSAEQSFFQLIKNGFKPKESYMMITPCERSEKESEQHLNIFLKLELISMTKTYKDIVKDVLGFYKQQGFKPTVLNTNVGQDININGIEVGSYGNRKYLMNDITYGTGLALPRISYALSMAGKYEI